MLYTLLGAISGGFLTYLFCKLTGINTGASSQQIILMPSKGQILILLGIIFGAGTGFGIGSYKLTHGNYLC